MKELTPKQELFIEGYCNRQSSTFGNGVKSYIAAGYKDGVGAMQAVSRLLSTGKIKAAIDKYNTDTELKIEIKQDYIRQQWLKLLDDCRTDGKYTDRTCAQSLLRTMAQSEAMLTDNIHTNTDQQLELDDAQKQAAKRIASISLKTG